MLKRLFDIIFSFFGLIFLSPLLVLLAIIIRKEDNGPVFYKGIRVGQYGKTFKMYKFRTMVADADKMGGPSSAEDDPRITKTGLFLRKYKLDELPQLMNVLRGEMSIVGPRPEVPYYVNMFSREEKNILSVPQGMTDWASLWNSDEGALLAGSPDPEKTYREKIRPEKIRLQLKYADHSSVLIDLQIMILTLFKILKQALKR